MTSKKDLLRRSDLYVILDRDISGDSRILRIAKDAIRAGASLLELRDKSSPSNAVIPIAKKIKKAASRHEIPFIINDRLDVALAVDADGLHIGEGDVPIKLARKMMGSARIIGRSADNLGEAARAIRDGADYIGVGPVFQTPIKNNKRAKGPGFLKRVKKCDIPVFAIGGIDLKNVAGMVAGSGIRKIAVIRAVSNARNPYLAARRLKKEIA